MRAIRVSRWRTGLVVAVAASLLAIGFGSPGPFLLAVVALGFVLVGYASGAPEPSLRLERELDETRPRPGQSVTVTVSVTNEGSGVAPDVRVVDDPPEEVPVTDGTPSFATAISPGETATHRYELTPPRGEHAFGEATVRVRNLASTVRATDEPDVDGTTTFTCETLLDGFPLRDRTIQFVGATPTDDGGTGVEFYATRDYRRGDPINRIDWHRLARTGELATVEYREERAVTIVFVVDDRSGIHRLPAGGGPDSYDLCLYAASRGVAASIEDGNRTGFATLTDDVWIDPGADDGVSREVDEVVAEEGGSDSSSPFQSGRHAVTDGAGPTTGRSRSGDRSRGSEGDRSSESDGGRLATELAERLPRNAQVVFCSPLSDETAIAVVERLRSLGRDVTVVAPDLTTGVSGGADTPGARIAGVERANRIERIRGLDATVIDWRLDEPISVELARVVRARGGGA